MEQPLGVCNGLAGPQGPEWDFKGPEENLEAPEWDLKGPEWGPKGPEWNRMGPEWDPKRLDGSNCWLTGPHLASQGVTSWRQMEPYM